MGMEVGTLAKSFSLPSSKGGSTKVPAKNASVVFFFQKSDTPGCSAEADEFDELAGDFAKKGVQVVGVSMEEVEALTASNEGRKIELLSDTDGEISEYFGAEIKLPIFGTKLGFSVRETFLISNKGEILDKWSEGKNMGTSSRAPTPSRCSRPSTIRSTPGSASPPSSAEGEAPTRARRVTHAVRTKK